MRCLDYGRECRKEAAKAIRRRIRHWVVGPKAVLPSQIWLKQWERNHEHCDTGISSRVEAVQHIQVQALKFSMLLTDPPMCRHGLFPAARKHQDLGRCREVRTRARLASVGAGGNPRLLHRSDRLAACRAVRAPPSAWVADPSRRRRRCCTTSSKTPGCTSATWCSLGCLEAEPMVIITGGPRRLRLLELLHGQADGLKRVAGAAEDRFRHQWTTVEPSSAETHDPLHSSWPLHACLCCTC